MLANSNGMPSSTTLSIEDATKTLTSDIQKGALEALIEQEEKDNPQFTVEVKTVRAGRSPSSVTLLYTNKSTGASEDREHFV